MSEKSIRLSDATMKLLKNYASINNSLFFPKGNTIETMLSSGGVFATATIEEEFPQDFSIYDLSNLLRVLSLPAFKDCDLVFKEDKPFMILEAGKSKIKYFFTSTDFVKPPSGRKIELPSNDFEFIMSDSMFSDFMKTAGVLGHTHMVVELADKLTHLCATNPEVDTSNDYRIELEPNEHEDYIYTLDIANLKFIPGDYKISFSNLGLARFIHESGNLTYYVGLVKGK